MLPLIALGATEDVGRRTGMAMTISAAGALAGPPISGAIEKASGGFKAVGYYAGTPFAVNVDDRSLTAILLLGSVILISVALMLTTRHLVLRRLWGKF